MKEYSFKIKLPYDEGLGKMTEARDMNNSIFLAGPCPRFDYHEDWRYAAFDILEELGFKGTVITPTNDNYSEMERHQPEALRAQTQWERTMMHLCSALVFWVPRCEKWPAFTTNVEFGEWYKKRGVYFGFPDDAIRMKYMSLKFAEQKKTCYNDLKKMLSDVVSDLRDAPERRWFTADTHFGQERTLQLSHRPFVDVTEMDLQLMSNWNKVVCPDDTVYHAGDFADFSVDGADAVLTNLNFKKLVWVLGNYDRKYMDKVNAMVDSFNREYAGLRSIELYDQTQPDGACEVTLSDVDGNTGNFVIIHEPVDYPAKNLNDVTYLYAHVHGMSFFKRNGFNIGTDCHQYTPISEHRVMWYKNSMRCIDQNVYSDFIVKAARK